MNKRIPLLLILTISTLLTISFSCTNYQKIQEGDKYIGKYDDNGLMTGQGTYIYLSGDKYEGQFFRGLKHGRGVYIYSSGDKYEGKFFKGLKQGKGVYIYGNNQKYIGNFNHDKMHGKGKIIYTDGSILIGIWEKDKFVSGQGIMISPNGSKFNGSYKNGKIYSGTGTLIYSDGTKYVGEFVKGKRFNDQLLKKLPKNYNKGKFGGGYRNYKWGTDYDTIVELLEKNNKNELKLSAETITVRNRLENDLYYFHFYKNLLYEVCYNTSNYNGWGNPCDKLIETLTTKYGNPLTRESSKTIQEGYKIWFATIIDYTWTDRITTIEIQSKEYQTGAKVVDNLFYSSVKINNIKMKAEEAERIKTKKLQNKF